MNKICCFAGHSKIYNKEEIAEHIRRLAVNLIENENVTEFWVGNYGDFDRLCASVIRDLKSTHKCIKLYLIIPYLTKEINDYRQMYYDNYDGISICEIPENTPKKFFITKCNQYMIKNSHHLICYVKQQYGGAYSTLKYARGKDIAIYNIAG